jgi:hypothetical protein
MNLEMDHWDRVGSMGAPRWRCFFGLNGWENYGKPWKTMEKNGKVWINGGVTYIWLEFLINTKFRMEIYGHLAELLEQVSGVLGLLGSEKKSRSGWWLWNFPG